MDSFGPGILQIELFKQKKQADSAAHKRCRLSDNIGYEHKNNAITSSKLAVSIEVCTKLHLQSGSQIPSGNQTCQGKSRRVFQSIFPNSNPYFEGMFPDFCIQTTIFEGFPMAFCSFPFRGSLAFVSGAVSQVGGHGETCSAAIQNGGGGCTGAVCH